MTVAEFVEALGGTCFEARNIARAAALLRRMIEGDSCIWLGIAGAGIAGGLGGPVSTLIANGFVDVICTTGAQAYHDLHFAFGLPVKAVSPDADDEELRRRGDTRIYDVGIREEETLEAQDDIICRFITERYDALARREPLSSPDFMMLLGEWVAECAPHPDRSFVVAAALARVPVFWDSFTNHSIALNVARMGCKGCSIRFSPQEDILLSAALVHGAGKTGFIELGGGGPKNFIQQTGPMISQILGIREFPGASYGLQVSTANVREGSLSGCTFGEAVTWGKYGSADEAKLVQVWGEYSYIFPMLVAYVLDRCQPRRPREIYARMPELRRALLDEARDVRRGEAAGSGAAAEEKSPLVPEPALGAAGRPDPDAP
jgi:deoxyhypusine synthase